MDKNEAATMKSQFTDAWLITRCLDKSSNMLETIVKKLDQSLPLTNEETMMLGMACCLLGMAFSLQDYEYENGVKA